MPPSKKKELVHCFRCHEDFDPNKPSGCIIEHDPETFQGSRNGTSWYTGKVGCCGAKYKFHRHNSEDKASPKYCFRGNHAATPNDVEYNGSSIVICTLEKCGKARHDASKAVYTSQIESKKKDARQSKKRRLESTNAEEKEDNQREARRLRAHKPGLDSNSDSCDSDVDSDSCGESDIPSDSSSIVPPWLAGEDSDY